MDLEESQASDPTELINLVRSAVKRYWMLAIGPALVTGALIVILAFRLPPYYTVDAQIYLEPQRLETKLAKQDNDFELERQRDALIEKILSRGSLQKIVERHNLYPEMRGDKTIFEVVRYLRKRIETIPVRTATGGKTANLFEVRFSYRDPDKTYLVVKELTDLFIEESKLATSTEVDRNVRFFDEQLSEARRELEETEKALNRFIQENTGRLPDDLDANSARLKSLEDSQRDIRRQVVALTESINRLTDERRLLMSVSSPDETIDAASPKQALRLAETTLKRLQAKYTPQHPDIIRMKKRIQDLKKIVREGGGSSGSGDLVAASPEVRKLSRQISDNQILVEDLKLQQEENKEEINRLKEVISSTSAVGARLEKIRRDYAATKERYDNLNKEKQSESLRSDVISSGRAAQFQVLDQPLKPTRDEASGPPRALIAGGGVLVSGLIVLLIPLLLFLINPAYKLVSQLESDIGVSVLGVIPPMETPHAICLNNKLIVSSLLISLVCLIVGGVVMFILL